MNKDIVVINKESNNSTSNENVDFESFNKTNFSSLSKNNSSNIDFGGESFGNYNDDDYHDEGDYSGGNYYDDSYDFNTKGNVYTDDFTEDYPDINQLYKQKLYKDIQKAYEKKTDDESDDNSESSDDCNNKTNNEKTTDENNKKEFKDLNLNFDTIPNYSNVISIGEIEFEPGKILIKTALPNSLNSKLNNGNKYSTIYFIIALFLFLSIPLFNLYFAYFLTTTGFLGISIYIGNTFFRGIRNHITTNCLILDCIIKYMLLKIITKNCSILMI